MLQAVKRAELEQAVLFWRKHELLGAFRTWQAWTTRMLHLKNVAVTVIRRMCLSCQVCSCLSVIFLVPDCPYAALYKSAIVRLRP